MWGGSLESLENYAAAREFCDTRRKRKLGHNTIIIDYGERILVRFHSTNLVEFRAGSVTLKAGGWETVTTRERINAYLPKGMWRGSEWVGMRGGVWQQLGRMYLTVKGISSSAETFHFQDGITLHDDGRVTLGVDGPEASGADPKADAREYNRDRARDRRRLKAEGYIYNGYRGWQRASDEERRQMEARDAARRQAVYLAPLEARDAGRERYERAPARGAELSRAERAESISRRIESVLAECNPDLPFYRPEDCE